MSMQFFDFSGALCSFTSTILYTRNNIFAWVICLTANLVNLYLYYKTGIFADAGLEIIYLAMAGYGIWHWLYGGIDNSTLKITNVPIFELIICLLLTLVGYFYIYQLLITHTNSNIAQLDALATVLSLCGQWFMCRKYIETWLIWLLVDCVLIVLFSAKNLPAHVLLNIVYLPIAIYGYSNWSKIQRHTRAQTAALALDMI